MTYRLKRAMIELDAQANPPSATSIGAGFLNARVGPEPSP
jgi:hypothetical protein